MKWQPIETAPSEKMVLVTACECKDDIYTAFFYEGYWEIHDGKSWHLLRAPAHPTHWMPLPEPPA